MTATIREREEELFADWSQGRTEFVPDGIVEEKTYLSSDPKLLFVLKEINDLKGKRTWNHLGEFLAGGAHPPTWDNVARWVLGIRR